MRSLLAVMLFLSVPAAAQESVVGAFERGGIQHTLILRPPAPLVPPDVRVGEIVIGGVTSELILRSALPPPVGPVIHEYRGESGQTVIVPSPATRLRILGREFGSTNGRLMWDGIEMEVISWTSGEIIARLPSWDTQYPVPLTIIRADNVQSVVRAYVTERDPRLPTGTRGAPVTPLVPATTSGVGRSPYAVPQPAAPSALPPPAAADTNRPLEGLRKALEGVVEALRGNPQGLQREALYDALESLHRAAGFGQQGVTP